MTEPATLERAYRMRCYPTVRQRRVLERLFGAVDTARGMAGLRDACS